MSSRIAASAKTARASKANRRSRQRHGSARTGRRRHGRRRVQLGDGNADSAVDSQGRALDALRKGTQGLAQSMHSKWDSVTARARTGGWASRARNAHRPLGRPMHGRDPDDFSVKVPGEIDVQRARRIIEELRRRFGDMPAPAGTRLHRAAVEGLLGKYRSLRRLVDRRSLAAFIRCSRIEPAIHNH